MIMEDAMSTRLPLPVAAILVCVSLWNAVTSDAHVSGSIRPEFIPHNCTWNHDREHQVTSLVCVDVGLTGVPDNFPDVDELRMEYNNMAVLDAIPYPSLRWVYLYSNQIYTVADRTFQNLTSIQTLNLANNSITSLSVGALSGLSSLRILVLQGNPLYEIGAGLLGSGVLPTLETLDMSDCRIYEFSPQAFNLGSPIQSLNASNNRLSSFQFLHNLKTLMVLDLSFNRLKDLPAGSFLGLSIVNDLQLAHNDVRHLGGDSFQGLTRLKKLDLSHNRLSTIEHSAFHHTPSLSHLDVSYNRFSVLSQDRLPWGSLSSLLVHNNPWDCGCRTAWLRSSKVLLINLESNLTCSSPSEVEGAAVYTINMSFFHCLDVARRASERALAIGLGVIIGLIIAMLATLLVYRLVFKARRRSRDGTLTVSASSPYSRVDSRELVLKGDDM